MDKSLIVKSNIQMSSTAEKTRNVIINPKKKFTFSELICKQNGMMFCSTHVVQKDISIIQQHPNK